MRSAVSYIRTTYPYWNASGGRDHVFFIFGERQTCLVPAEIARTSIVRATGHPAFCLPYCLCSRPRLWARAHVLRPVRCAVGVHGRR